MFSRIKLLLLLLFAAPLYAAPTVTVTATSASILGTNQPISLTCVLTDPNQTGILRSGANVITVLSTSTTTPGNTATCGPLYGNDAITDGFGNALTTYYLIAVYTVHGGIVDSTPSLLQAYQFAGSGTFDLSATLPFSLGPVSPAGSVLGQNLAFTGNNTHSGTETFTGLFSTALLNGDYVTGSTTYPLTGAGLQAAITAAAGLGCVYAVRGTYTMTATLTIPSNTCIYWDNATVATNGFAGDIISSTGTSNVTFRGKLIINGSAQVTANQGLNLLTVANFSFDDIEGNGSGNACIQMLGVSHVRGNKIYLKGCGAGTSTSANFFIANNSTTPSTDIIIHEIDISAPGGSAPEDGFYVSGTIATPSQRINVVSLILNGCSDSCLEINFAQFVNIGKVITVSPTNSAVLIRRGDTDVNIDSVACSGAVSYTVCVDIANFQASDPSEQRITIGQVTASNASKDLTNGAAVRVSNSITTSTITNISFGQIIADTSTRGFYCTATATAPNAHITVGSLIAHNSKGDGVFIGSNSATAACNDVVINTLISFDNGIGGTTDEGDGVRVFGAAGVVIGSGRVFDDQGGGKTQKYGVSITAPSTNVSVGLLDCQDTLEITACWNDVSTNAFAIRRSDGTGRITFTATNGGSFSNSAIMLGLNDFGGQSAGKVFEDSNAANCTNGELALSAGWQSTGSATVTAVAGHGQTCSWTITTGTTTAANPTVTDTLTQALGSATTVCEIGIYGGTHTAVAGESLRQTTLSATAPIFTANFTPTAGGTTYFVTRRCGP